MNSELAPPYHLFTGDNYTVMIVILGVLLFAAIIAFISFLAGAADRKKQIHLAELDMEKELRQIDRDIRVAEIEAGAKTRVAEIETRVLSSGAAEAEVEEEKEGSA